MRYLATAVLLSLLALVCALPTGRAQPPRKPKEPLVNQVDDAIQRGVKYLRGEENNRGDLERAIESRVVPGGVTALATLALLNAGVPPEDPMVQRLLEYLRGVKLEPRSQTYTVALQTMVYALARQDKDKERIQKNVDWLVAARHVDANKRLVGWTYSQEGSGGDNSNTQYALLGLHEGQQAGAVIPREVWESIREYYSRETKNGVPLNWGYHTGEAASPTMTTAALCGLLIAGMDLNAGRETIDPDGTVQNCGVYAKNEAVEKALEMVGRQVPRTTQGIGQMPAHIYYWLYGLERAGRLSGQRFLGETDWYRLGCEYLVAEQQKPEGYWRGSEGGDIISTCFALLFLSKGRTPVLISKLVHDPEGDWDNDRNDVRNLVQFASTELFKRQPLAWQIYDARRAGDLTPQRIEELTADLLQSPIAYFNGHKAPRFTDGEEELLRQYVANGGFLYVEDCCESPPNDEGFDKGFRALMVKLFPDTPLERLKPTHPIWTASNKVAADPEKDELWGIESGCKTVVVYHPHGHSCCWWESNDFAGRGKDAFWLGANVIAYATGLEPPKPRLTEMDVFKGDDTDRRTPRNYLKVAQLEHDGDWHPAPRAMPTLMQEMRKLGLDVALQTEEMRIPDRSFTRFKFLYMHGRKVFNISEADRKRLRFNLETGGLLLADACCGAPEFDRSFRQLMKDLWADHPLEPVPLDDRLFSKELNGKKIEEVRCRRETPDGKGTESEARPMAPQLEGVRINGRWVVIYSKYDIGCALENHPSVNCRGYDHPSAVELAKAAVFYALKP